MVKRVELDTGTSVQVDFEKMTVSITGARADVLRAEEIIENMTVPFIFALSFSLLTTFFPGGAWHDV